MSSWKRSSQRGPIASIVYESTRDALDELYDRVPSGGVEIFDDYGFWQGAREAIDEFLDRSGARVLLVPMASGRIMVKP